MEIAKNDSKNFSIGVFYNITKNQDNPIKTVGRDSFLIPKTNTKILSSHFFAIFILNPYYDVINDVISGFVKVVVERCGFHHWIAQSIS